MKRIALIRDEVYLEHKNPPWHPENPERLTAINRMLSRFPYKDQLFDIPARDATDEEISWIHEPGYIEQIKNTREREFTMFDADTSACCDSYSAAVRAAGGTLEAVEAVMTGRCQGAFALVRPPGHHAEANRAMGFCLFNNVAIAAEYARRRHRIRRIAILDWDVHHGNGTMHSFYGSNEILYFSIHEYPHYPGTGILTEIGEAEGRGYTANVPLPGGQGNEDYMAVLQRIFRPIIQEFQPELTLVSAGFDGHVYDPLAGMVLTNEGYAAMTSEVIEVSAAHTTGKIVFVLEGGYQLHALAASVSSVLHTLLGLQQSTETMNNPLSDESGKVIEKVISLHREYWQSLK